MSKSNPTVYLAGPISGLTYEGATDWREWAAATLDDHRIRAFSPMRAKNYLAAIGIIPSSSSACKDDAARALYEMPLSTDKGICTRDRDDCTRCDLILMNLTGAATVSIGSMIEMGWADAARNPIVLAMEPGNVHEHAMVRHLAGYVVPTLDEALHLTVAILQAG